MSRYFNRLCTSYKLITTAGIRAKCAKFAFLKIGIATNAPQVMFNLEQAGLLTERYWVILTWRGSNCDQKGDSSRARLFHCTRTGLTPAITANVGNSTVQFLVVGVCVRAHPLHYSIKSKSAKSKSAIYYLLKSNHSLIFFRSMRKWRTKVSAKYLR